MKVKNVKARVPLNHPGRSSPVKCHRGENPLTQNLHN